MQELNYNIMMSLALFAAYAWAVRRRVLKGRQVVWVGSLIGAFATCMIYRTALAVTQPTYGADIATWYGVTAAMMLPFVLATIYGVHAFYLGVVQKHLATVTIRNTKVRLIIGNLADLRRRDPLDALICPTNTDLVMLLGIAGELKSFGGAIIEQQAREQAPLKIGQAIVTTAGKLNAKYVIHAAMTGTDLRIDMEKVKLALEGALRCAAKIDARRIALPPFRSRVGSLKPADVAPVMMEGIIRELRNFDEITIVVRPGREASAFQIEFANLAIQFPAPALA